MTVGLRITQGLRTGRPAALHGATLVEAVIVLPILLFLVLGILQAALVFHAKGLLNYATHEAARAGTVHHASVAAIREALGRGLLAYYGGGRTRSELAASAAKRDADLDATTLRIEILSPTQQSFIDYNSPRLQETLDVSAPVIPNVGLDELTCPRDVPDCNADPEHNASGQTLLDANLLALRTTYGIPPAKQMPLVGRFYTWALDKTGAAHGDPFVQRLIDAGRIPLVTRTVMRMQSAAIRNAAMASLPGPGNKGTPVDPGPGETGTPLPTCPWWDPACTVCTDGLEGLSCSVPTRCDATDPDTCGPSRCEEGDASCDPRCGIDYCCIPPDTSGGTGGAGDSGTDILDGPGDGHPEVDGGEAAPDGDADTGDSTGTGTHAGEGGDTGNVGDGHAGDSDSDSDSGDSDSGSGDSGSGDAGEAEICF